MNLDWIEKTYNSLIENPALTISLLMIGALISWKLSNFLNQRSIQIKDDKIDRLSRDIDNLRERLSLDPAKGTAYSRMTLEELKEATFELVEKIREIKVKYQQRPVPHGAYGPDSNSETPELLAWRAELRSKTIQLAAAYDNHYKTDAILIRNELSNRLNEKPHLHDLSSFDHPVNHHGAQEVIDTLEEKAKRLI